MVRSQIARDRKTEEEVNREGPVGDLMHATRKLQKILGFQ
jgi:hypothetical protein